VFQRFTDSFSHREHAGAAEFISRLRNALFLPDPEFPGAPPSAI
jgi:hypothetical protein